MRTSAVGGATSVEFLKARVVALSELLVMLLALASVAAVFANYSAMADVLVSFRHLFALGCVPPLLVLAFARRRVLVAVALVTLVGNLATIADTLPLGGACESNLTVATVNALGPDNDVPATLAMLAHADADIVVVTELGGALDTALRAVYPHSFSFPDESVRGMGLFSRFPLAEKEKLPGAWFPQLFAKASIGGEVVTLFAAHPPPPFSGENVALRDEELRGIASRVETTPGPLILAGDFNITRQSPKFRALLGTRLEDSRVGQGVEGTWPAASPFRVGIDHILHSAEFTTCGLETAAPNGSDHLPLIAQLRH